MCTRPAFSITGHVLALAACAALLSSAAQANVITDQGHLKPYAAYTLKTRGQPAPGVVADCQHTVTALPHPPPQAYWLP